MMKRNTADCISEKEELHALLSVRFKRWRKINKWIDRVILSILLFMITFIGSGLIDSLMILEEGFGTIKYHSFTQLIEINPDTEAWLIMDGTHIDHPVVRSSDNFDYLDKGFEGNFYAGGTLFIDKDNEGFGDPYCIIHGHHMAGGAMFGDLEKYLNEGFFRKNHTGRLLTAEYDYDIEVFAAGVFNAYDRKIYKPGETIPFSYLTGKAINLRDAAEHKHVLALSTCLGEMTDDRIVVFCGLTGKRAHR